MSTPQLDIAYEMLEDAANALDSAAGWAILAEDDALNALASGVARELWKVIQAREVAS